MAPDCAALMALRPPSAALPLRTFRYRPPPMAAIQLGGDLQEEEADQQEEEEEDQEGDKEEKDGEESDCCEQEEGAEPAEGADASAVCNNAAAATRGRGSESGRS